MSLLLMDPHRQMLPNAIAAMIWVGISAYAVFGGADFGAGAWDLIAGGPEKGRRARALIEQAIGPVWEANHVWLIFVLVFLWTAFPEPFVSIGTTMWIPLTMAALGIIFRGSGFAFRKWADTVGRERFYGAAFAGASVITPFFLGTVAGGVASGRVPLGNAAGETFGSWLNPTSIFGGLMAVVATAYVAAVLIAREADLDNDTEMTNYFRQRALVTGIIAGGLAVIGVFVLASDAPVLFRGLISPRGIVLLALSTASGLASVYFLYRGRYFAARPAAALATVSVLWGWGAGQYPWVLEGVVTIDEAAASNQVLRALVIVFIAASLLAMPSLLWLYRLTQSRRLGEGEMRSDSTEALMRSGR